MSTREVNMESLQASGSPITVAQYLAMPDDDRKVELVRGRLVREPPPAPLHGRFQVRVGRLLDEFVEAHDLGVVMSEVGFLLARRPDTVRIPDLCFVSRARIPEDGYTRALWEMAPDLAVEIVSPGNRLSEMQEKVLDYLDAGAREVWVVDPGRGTIVVHRPGGEARLLRDADELGGGDVLPGFRLSLPRLFAL
jgi:Uma2 family endonuclease